MEHLEIERKFLVRSKAYREQATSTVRMIQGFLNTHPDRTVRVRVRDNKGYLTVKGASNEIGTTRFEWEMEINRSEAINLIDLCEGIILEKVRYLVPFGTHIYEVDEFLGENNGLIIAEVELQHEDEVFDRPNWLGEEVTGDNKYYNSQLSKVPFSSWP